MDVKENTLRRDSVDGGNHYFSLKRKHSTMVQVLSIQRVFFPNAGVHLSFTHMPKRNSFFSAIGII